MDDARKLRDDKLKENGLTLEKEVKNKNDIFAINNDNEESKKETKPKKLEKVQRAKIKVKLISIYMN